ncbi:helix-turn-helix domain-containing protein [Lactococcus garvieae]|uniref:helix-turn-helix domain-containing protein n=1 Tax=Lactococcus garvieae TaxID=1363 RepID=UPI0018D7CFF2|nr:helix-turn-helix domain-containing protein [Lactococcus garvieae]QPS70269.1 helix-turn-helix domain-containing protein [Lactococcus garvieae]
MADSLFIQYLEKDIYRKSEIVTMLWENEHLTSKEKALNLQVTTATIKADVKSINQEYCDSQEPIILANTVGYYIPNKKKKNKREFLKQMYQDSLFVRACCFFLKNNIKHVDVFAEKEWISIAKAYRVRNTVVEYLARLNISLSDEEIINNECRIRFLMAFYQWKVGIDLIEIIPQRQLIFNQLFSEIEEVEKCLFSQSSKEYASLLLQLSFSREKKTPIFFDEDSVQILKKTKIYQRLSGPIEIFLKKNMYKQVTEHEVFYFALVFNIMNANYYDNQRLSETYDSYAELIKTSPRLYYKQLVEKFETKYNISLVSDSLFEVSLISFLRKCLFNLQILIPEEHLERGHIARVPAEFLEEIKEILEDWNMEARRNLIFSNAHFQYLASKLFFVLNKKTRPKRLFLLSSFYADYLLAKEVITHEYGALVKIQQFNPQMKTTEYNSEDLILYDTDYDILKKIHSKKLQIGFVFDLEELQNIREELFEYELSKITNIE